MPIFEFRCLECGNLFEKIVVKSDETMEMVCPQCRCESIERVLSRTSHVMAKGAGERPTLTTKSCGSGNSCYTLDVPGPTK
jgi:putative FmdB family regulatory protein